MTREYPLLVINLVTSLVCIKSQKPPKPFKWKLKNWFAGMKHDLLFVNSAFNHLLKQTDAG
jgi:hypothetical protein